MDQKEILKHVDHTQLRAFATWEDIQKLCEEAIRDLLTKQTWLPKQLRLRLEE